MLGVGAVALRRDQVLLIERGREPLEGYWSLPGGVVEVGETLEQAVAREGKEETGLEVTPLALVEIFERLILDRRSRPEYHYVLIDFLCRARAGKPVAGDDVRRAEWVSIKRLEQYRLTEGTLEVIRKALRRREELRK
ncbi:MAG: NUDIX hydrolase [Acidobacteria bacterium]|nr:NUDIX hydrolase [Acidobacteriota bacterium]